MNRTTDVTLIIPSLLALAAVLMSTASLAGDAARSHWIGKYNGFSGACSRYDLTIERSGFNWMDCKGVSTRDVVVSQKQYAFLVDPASSCSWAGHVVSLTSQAPKAPDAIAVHAYKDETAFRNKHYRLFCAYARSK